MEGTAGSPRSDGTTTPATWIDRLDCGELRSEPRRGGFSTRMWVDGGGVAASLPSPGAGGGAGGWVRSILDKCNEEEWGFKRAQHTTSKWSRRRRRWLHRRRTWCASTRRWCSSPSIIAGPHTSVSPHTTPFVILPFVTPHRTTNTSPVPCRPTPRRSHPPHKCRAVPHPAGCARLTGRNGSPALEKRTIAAPLRRPRPTPAPSSLASSLPQARKWISGERGEWTKEGESNKENRREKRLGLCPSA